MKKSLFAGIIFLGTTLSIEAQKISIENVYKMTLRNSDAIKEGTDVKGYYFFYMGDKIDKNTNEYTLRIMDNNLKLLKDIKFQDTKEVTILESSFNGSDLIFLFYNQSHRTFEYQIYNTEGNKKFSYTRNLTKKEEKYLEVTYLINKSDEEQTYKGLYPVEKKGFISNMPSREEKDYTFQVDFFSSEKNKYWSYIPTGNGKVFIGDYLGTLNDIVYIEVLKLTGIFDFKPDSYIVGLSLETGKQIFEKKTDGKNRFFPMTISEINGKPLIFGQYYKPNGKVLRDYPQGFAFWSIDDQGNLLSERYCSFNDDLAKFFKIGRHGNISDFGFLFLHNFIQTSDGKFFAIGEGYKYGGVGSLIITDMMLIRFDQEFNVQEARTFAKEEKGVSTPTKGVELPLLATWVKYRYGGFDYVYTQSNKDISAFTICYSDYVRSRDYKGGTFNSISYNDGKVTTDRLNTKSDATRSFVLPGKQGQVLVVDYYKKEKRLDIHFEKLN
jgi:hypothetical protein